MKTKNKGGRPRKSPAGAVPLGFSIDRATKTQFDLYADQFADGNRSEMFRRMFAAWERMMLQVVGPGEKSA